MMNLIEIEQQAIAKKLTNLSAEKRIALIELLIKEGIDPLKLPIIPAIRESKKFPPSLVQERLWFVCQLLGASTSYNIYYTVRVTGELDVAALEQAMAEIMHRHEVLRTTFLIENETLVQTISPTPSKFLTVLDLQSLPAQEQATEVQRLITEEVRRPFDLAKGPLLRATALRLAEKSYVVSVTIHHIVFDGWSTAIFVREFAALYKAFAQGLPSPLPKLPIQYGDFALWQRQWLSGKVLENLLNYWQQQLAGAPPLLELPTDRPRPPVQTFRGRAEEYQFNADLSQKLKVLSQQSGVTLFMLLLAAFVIFLSRYSGQEDIVVGTPTANRNRGEVESLIGFFVNTLILRTTLEGNPTFAELLERVKRLTLEAYDHQDLPFEELLSTLKLKRDPSYNLLFQVMFILQNHPGDKLAGALGSLPGLNLSLVELEHSSAMFDFTLAMTEGESGLISDWEYNSDLFDESTIRRMIGNFETLLEGIVVNPQQHVFNLPLLTAAERQQLLMEWNDTQVEYPQNKCIHQLFEAQVELTPDAIAVVFKEQQLTYQELNEQAERLASYLQKLGVGPEVLVGVCVDRSLEMVVGLLGILKAGGAYLALDPNYPQKRLNLMLSDAQVLLLLTQEKLAGIFLVGDIPVICLDRDWEIISQQNKTNLVNSVTPENLAYVVYTSGSTGTPKGIEIAHQSLVNAYQSWEKVYQLRSLTSHLQMASFSFDVFSGDLIRALCSGAKLVLCPRELLLEPEKLYKLMRQEKIDSAEFVPAVLRNLVEYLERTKQDLDFMRLLIVGSDSLYVKEYEKFKHFCGSNTRLINSYGAGEATIDSTYFETTKVNLSVDGLVPIGRPFVNTQTYILDRYLQPVPSGVVGELHIGGIGLARGYRNRPDLTQQKFIPNPFEKSKLLYKTGDLARYLSDGNIEFLGRIDNQVKIRGFRIELGEIEAVLRQHPQVRETVVLTREDKSGNKQLVTYVVPHQDLLTAIELRRYLKENLPDYMVPSVFVMLEALPVTPNGKIDRKALPAPETDLALTNEYVPPQTPTQEILANLCAQVLSVNQLGIHDNFFELGGHSLLAMQLISRIRQTFKLEIPFRTLFESPTVAELEQSIDQERQTNNSLQIPPPEAILRDGQPLPLSWAQERLWFLDQLEGASATYNMPGAMRISGNLDVNAFGRALSEIVRRHEVLRTSFPSVNGIPVQVIHPEANLNIKVEDLQQLAATERETFLHQQAQLEAITPFDLERAPLIRCSLWQLDTREYVLLLNMHHIVSDGWSMGVFIKELSSLYQAFAAGKPSSLPELSIQYADFAVWQRQWLSGEVLETQLNYWKQQLDGVPELLQLPTDHPRPTVQTYQGTTKSFTLNIDLTQKLQALSRKSGTTLFMTLLAAFATLLYRYSGQSDILIGSPIANRNRSEIESLIGFFINTLVLRTSFEDSLSFEKLLTQVRENTLLAYEHQDLPFERVVEALQPQRSLSHSPLFQVMFVLQNTPMAEVELPDVTLSELNQESTIAMFDLTLSITETDQGLVGEWEYNTDLFDGETIERMATHFQNLLSAIVENPQLSVAELPLLSEAERHQLLTEWNDTVREYPTDKCIHQLFEEQVERTPDAVAVVFEKEQLTYQQLNQRANQLAHHLLSLGVGPEVLVGICLERSIEMVVGLLGILKAGGAYLPLDPNYPQERLSYMLADSAVEVLLTQQSLLQSLPSHTSRVVCLDTDWGVIEQLSQDNLDMGLHSDNLAYVINTSGSTGQPKGVLVAHRNLVNAYFAWEEAYQLKTEARKHLQMANFSFDVFTGDLVRALCSGGKLVLCPIEYLLVAEKLYELMLLQEIDFAEFVPAVLRNLMEYLDQTKQDLSFMKVMIVGSDSWYIEEHEKLRDLCSEKTRLINSYGVTEATVDSCYFENTCTQELDEKLVPIGNPFANTQIYILDAQLQPVPIGVPGELHIGGNGLARGYLNRPELTQAKFIPNPFNNSEKLYKTGDLARYLPNGNIEFLGRIDNQVKIRGFRIELGEIEAVLNTHSQIQQAVVIAREDIPANKRLVVYVVIEDESLSILQLREFLKQKLPEYMVPAAFVTLDTLPLTPNGKVDRKALPAPDGEITREHEYVAPRTAGEQIIANIFANVLGVQNVGIHDNFFELGGHSLLATQLISRLRVAFEVEIPLRTIFSSPTIAQLEPILAQLRSSGQGLSLPSIQPREADREQLPLSWAQERLWFINQLEGSSATYNMPEAVRISGNFDVNAFGQALSEIVSRHEVLRTSFQTVDGIPVQVIHPEANININFVDLQQLEATERETVLHQQAQQEAIIPFNLEIAPLIRCSLWQLDAEEYVLLLTMHHIVSDDWSMGVFIKELSALYQAICAGEPSPLPELPIQYADFAIWQRQWLSGEVIETQLKYWKQQLDGAPELLPLPTDYPRPKRQTYRGASQTFTLGTELTQKLQILSRESDTTLFMTLLAGFQVLLQRYTNQDDIVVGTDVANRNRPETEPLIGFFVNLLVLRTDLSGNPSFRELLKRVQEVALGAYVHQDLPFEKLVEALRPDRQLSHTPLFQVLLVLQNTPKTDLELPGLTFSFLEMEDETTKFDLGLFLTETEQGIEGCWRYNADLFQNTTIKRMLAHFETLLQSIVSQPDTRINSLEMLTNREKEQQVLKKKQHKASKLKKLMAVQPKAVELSQDRFVKTDYLQPGAILPLVITTEVDDLNIIEWSKSNRDFIETKLLQNGAILFRNFGVNSVADFESFAEAICPGLFGEYGDLPREGVSGKVYGSTPYPQNQAILFHNESSHMHCWPQKIWFFCAQPAQQGGETPIVDCRKVFKLLDSKLLERFEQKQLMYVRNYTDGLDVSWQDFFNTTDKVMVENYCRQAGIDFKWLPGNGLRTCKVRPAVTKHPKTGEQVFFNQLQLHHVSCLEPAVRESLLSMFGEENPPRNVYYGDGSPIEDSVIAEISTIYQETQVSFPWQQGDILMLDNMLTAHGRNPYLGSRKIVVAMGEMIRSKNI